jgi:trehalose utilization protein
MVDRIQKIENGEVSKSAVRYSRNGGEFFECFEPGETMNPIWFATLDEVAAFLRSVPKRRVRMDPGSAMTSRHIHIDDEPL